MERRNSNLSSFRILSDVNENQELESPLSSPPPNIPSNSSHDSLMESILAQKMSKGLFKRSNSIDSTCSVHSISSISSETDCPCDDCILGITDVIEYNTVVIVDSNNVPQQKKIRKKVRELRNYQYYIIITNKTAL